MMHIVPACFFLMDEGGVFVPLWGTVVLGERVARGRSPGGAGWEAPKARAKAR